MNGTLHACVRVLPDEALAAARAAEADIAAGGDRGPLHGIPIRRDGAGHTRLGQEWSRITVERAARLIAEEGTLRLSRARWHWRRASLGLVRERLADDPASNPDILLGSAVATGISRIGYAPRLDQEHFDLALRIRLVLNPLRNDEHLSRSDMHRAIAEIDA